ncbi:MAG TPA: hypothetical protein VH370_08305 [Humisphaera sp.]|jgi:Spy/CpxP family protein refolding chaperone|nr:hypothetical protein [Humisphaera sp.]
MSNLKLAIVLGFALMFIAGLAVGRSPADNRETPAMSPQRPQHSWLGNQLHLSAEQEKQMKAIWSSTAVTRPDLPKQFHECDKDRDQAILDLLTPEQRQQFDRIQLDHKDRVEQLNSERSQSMRDAEDQTRQILSEDQRKKYDDILKAHGHHGPPRNAMVHRRARGGSETEPAHRD